MMAIRLGDRRDLPRALDQAAIAHIEVFVGEIFLGITVLDAIQVVAVSRRPLGACQNEIDLSIVLSGQFEGKQADIALDMPGVPRALDDRGHAAPLRPA